MKREDCEFNGTLHCHSTCDQERCKPFAGSVGSPAERIAARLQKEMEEIDAAAWGAGAQSQDERVADEEWRRHVEDIVNQELARR